MAEIFVKVKEEEFVEVDPTIHVWELTNYDAVFKIGKKTFPFEYAVCHSRNEDVKQINQIDYKLWFGVFEDFSGAELLVYYPIKARKDQIIRVWIVDNWSNKKWYEEWRHGKPGLCDHLLVWIIMDFVDYITFNTA